MALKIYHNEHTNRVSNIILDNNTFIVNETPSNYSLQISLDYQLFGEYIYINIRDILTGDYILATNLLFIKPFSMETLKFINLDENSIYQINIIDTKHYGLQSSKGIQIYYYYQQQILQHYDINGNFGTNKEIIIMNQTNNRHIKPIYIPMCSNYFNLELLSFKILERTGCDKATIELKYKSNVTGTIKWELYSYIICNNLQSYYHDMVVIDDIYTDLIQIQLTLYNLNLVKFIKFTLDNNITISYEIINFNTSLFLDTNTRLHFYPDGNIDLYLVIDTITQLDDSLVTFNINYSHSFYLEKQEILNNRIKYKLSIPYQPDFVICSNIPFSYYFIYQYKYYYQGHCLENIDHKIFSTSNTISIPYENYDSILTDAIFFYKNRPYYDIDTIIYNGTNEQLQLIRNSKKPFRIIVQDTDYIDSFRKLFNYIIQHQEQLYLSFHRYNDHKMKLSTYINTPSYTNLYNSFNKDDMSRFSIKPLYQSLNLDNFNFWYSKKGTIFPDIKTNYNSKNVIKNYLPIHHDGNKYNFNFCLQGKKQWFLKPPNHNVLLNDFNDYKHLIDYKEIIMESNQIIYLPEYWIHRVNTLQDTICFNFWYDDFLNHETRFIL